MDGFLVPSGGGAVLRNPLGGPLAFKARADETGGALTAFESVATPGEGPPLHRHPEQDELIYFLDDHFRVLLGVDVRDAAAGSVIFIPKGLAHTWQNVSAAPARLLVLFVPGARGMEAFFEHAATLEGDAAKDAFASLGPDAGMEVLGPPLAQSHPLR